MIDLLFRVFSILSVNFSLEFKSSELVVSIRSLAQLTTEQKEWKSKRLAIEVPLNVSHYFTSVLVPVTPTVPGSMCCGYSLFFISWS